MEWNTQLSPLKYKIQNMIYYTKNAYTKNDASS